MRRRRVISCRRWIVADYKSTINLPNTGFPMKADLAKATKMLRDTDTKISNFQAQLEDWKKIRKKSDQRFLVWVAVAWLSLVANLIVFFLGR